KRARWNRKADDFYLAAQKEGAAPGPPSFLVASAFALGVQNAESARMLVSIIATDTTIPVNVLVVDLARCSLV
ncbi:MAG TPA: hypothetical protein VLQ68_02260, partial [Rhizobiaceae bacterium]|nr:hypothetical protein [Rhizobiaceae bacterium]